MIRAVPTRWNTTAELIGCAKDLRLALNLLVNMEQHNKSRGVRLKRFQLSLIIFIVIVFIIAVAISPILRTLLFLAKLRENGLQTIR